MPTWDASGKLRTEGGYVSLEANDSYFKPCFWRGWMCCCGCWACVLFLLLPWYAAGQLIVVHKSWAADLYVNCTEYPKHYCTDHGDFWTPANGTRYLSWGGCRQGWKSDAELTTCGGDCFGGVLPISMDDFNSKHQWKLVSFPSRKGKDGQKTANITAWWLPSGKANAPRVVVQHGNNANFNSRMVQTAAYLLRSIGIDVLVPSLRDHGFSEYNELYTTWGWSYPLDTLGAWDYAVNDPDGKLGGKADASKVGLMGFSMGGFLANTAFGMEGRVPGVWTDGAVFSPSTSMKGALSFLGPLVELVVPIAMNFAVMQAGVDILKYTPAKTLPTGPKTKRHIMLVNSALDTFVPPSETKSYIKLAESLPEQYTVQEWMPKATCNGNAHCAAMFDFAAQDREKLCTFWGKVFGFDKAACDLDNLPKFTEVHVSKHTRLLRESPTVV